MPYWVGNLNTSTSTSTSTSTRAHPNLDKVPSSTLSEGGVIYHVNYLLGAKKFHNISFNWVGIWNESPWTKEYILLLRKGLDNAGEWCRDAANVTVACSSFL